MLRMFQVIWNRPLSSLSRQWVSKISVKAPREVTVLNYVSIFNIVQTTGASIIQLRFKNIYFTELKLNKFQNVR